MARAASTASSALAHAARGHHRNAVGLQQGLGLGLGEQVPALGHRVGDQFAAAGGCARGHRHRAAWRFEQQCLVGAVGREHAEGAHRFFGRFVAGQAGSLKDLARLAHRFVAQPAAHHAVGRGLGDGRAGACDVGALDDGRGRVHEQDGGRLRVGHQRLQGADVTFDGRVADDVHRVGARPVPGQHRIERCDRGVGQRAQGHAGEGSGVGCHHAGTAAVGQDGQRVAAVGAEIGQRFCGHEQLGQRVHAQHAGAADGAVDHDVRARQRAGV